MPGQLYLAGGTKLKQRKGTDVKTAFVVSLFAKCQAKNGTILLACPFYW